MADTKNYGLKGIGNDVQLGKGGPRITLSGGVIQARNVADGDFAIVRGLDPVGANDLTTKSYVDSVAQGLDYKESCQAATTGNIGTYAAGGGAGGTGQLTSVAATIDGVTLAQGDRVLVKDQTLPVQNGIYVVTSTTTTLDRASDHNQGGAAGDVSAGNFTFVEAGTVNANTSWVVTGDGNLTLNTDDIDWVLFSTTTELLAGNGLVKNGNTIDLDFSELTSAATIATADELIFQDAGVESRITVANFLADRDIVTATADGILTRTANDTYASRTLTASTVAGDQGISIVNGNGVSGNPTIGLDITGLTAAGTLELADTIVVFDGTNNVEATFTDVVQDLDIPNAITTNGFIARTGADTYASRTITASAVAGDEGISVTGGDGSATPTIGLDIVGQTNLTTDDIDDADELLIYHSIGTGTEGIGNYAVTASKLKSYMNAGTSTTTITEGDSSVAVSDAGSGTITTTVDSTAVITSIAASTSFNHDVIVTTGDTLTLTDLTENDVMVVGASGVVEDSGGALTFNGTTLGVTGAAQIDNINIDGNTISSTAGTDLLITPLAGQQLLLDTLIIVDNGSMTGITTLGFDGVSLTAIQTSGEGFADNDTSIMTSAAIDDRILSYGYSTTTGTVTSSGSPLSNEVAVFTSGTDIDSDSTFTWDATTLTVNELSFAGDTISNNTTDQPIIIRPNGTGSIIFQNGSSEEILELNDTASAINGLAITAGATGNPAQITTGTGSEANIDIGFLTNGTGVLSVTAGSGNYEDNVTAADDIPNKQYVDDAVASGVGLTGNLDSVTGTVSLTSAATVNIGAATGIPANCTIMSVTLEIDTASDAVTTVTVGDATNGAASYMAATENDPEVLGIYIADGRVANGGAARQATATVATPGTVGSATCIITFRHA